MGLADMFSGFTESDADKVCNSLAFHPHFSKVSSNGIAVIIASAVSESALIDNSVTMYDRPESLSDEFRPSSPDDHASGYNQSKKLVGLYNFDSTLVVIFICKSPEQQRMFGNAVDVNTKSKDRSSQLLNPSTSINLGVAIARIKASLTTSKA